VVEWMLDDIDLMLVMTINPGFGGQSFMPSQLAKIEALRKMVDRAGRNDIIIEVDGGVNQATARQCLDAGATALVAGTAVFRGGPSTYADAIAALRGAAPAEAVV
jgi:ribulose-phosphate 3-epimerase